MSTIRYTAGGDYDPNNSVDIVPAPLSFDTLRANFFEGMFAVESRGAGYYLHGTNSSTDGIYADFSDALVAANMTGGDRGDVLRSGVYDDILNGGAGDDVLEGGAGGDTFDGGDGFNTVSYEHSTAGLTVANFIVPSTGDAADDSFTDIQAFIGTAYDDEFVLAGSSYTIEGGAGADTIGVAFGIGTASYEHSAEAVHVDLSGATANSGGDAEGDAFQGIFNLLGSANADTLIGDSQDNVLRGKGGLDTIDGGDGNDTIGVTSAFASVDGGAGTDRLVIGQGVSVVAVAGSIANFETIVVRAGATVDLSALDAPVGRIVASDSFFTLTTIVGTQGADRILTGAFGTYDLNGAGGDDRIFGGIGSDRIDGGGGADRLFGRAGGDTFVFSNVSDSTVGSADRIIDFSTADGDRIDVSALGFTSLKSEPSAAIGQGQLLVVDKGDGNYIVVGDADHDGTRDFGVRVHSDGPLTADSFVFAQQPAAAIVEAAHHAFLELQHPLNGLALA